MIIECVDPSRFADQEAAINELAKLIKENLGGEYEIHILDRNNKSVVIE